MEELCRDGEVFFRLNDDFFRYEYDGHSSKDDEDTSINDEDCEDHTNMARHQRSCRVWDPGGGPSH